MGIKDYIRDAQIFSGYPVKSAAGNTPSGTGQKDQWFSERTSRFLEEKLQYATDFFEAEAHGLDPKNPQKRDWVRIRVVRLLDNSAVGTNFNDSWRTVIFERSDITYIPQGAKLWFWNSCWLVYNPNNIGTPRATAIIRRCDAVWNSLDEYGNVISEPFVLNKQPTKANMNRYQELGVLAENYIDCVMACTPHTRTLKENDRMILGSAAYAVRGLNDFTREFTDDPDSVRLLFFSIARQEPTEHDDMERQIAGGRSMTFEIELATPKKVMVGDEVATNAVFRRSGSIFDGPTSYVWEATGSAAVDDNGKITGVSEGGATIICRLAQNPAVEAVAVIEVTGEREASLAICGPDIIRQFGTETFSVEGINDAEPEIYVEGPELGCYTAAVDGRILTVTCEYPSNTPMEIKAICNNLTATKNVRLIGR